MATYVYTTSEHATTDSLRDAIAGSIISTWESGYTPPGGTGAPTGTWFFTGWSGVGGGSPYLQLALHAPAFPHNFQWRFRFAQALLGMMDPASWWNGANDPCQGKLDPLTLQSHVLESGGVGQVEGWFEGLPLACDVAGLFEGTILERNMTLDTVPTGSSSAGLYHGGHFRFRYQPSASEDLAGLDPVYYSRLHEVTGGLAEHNVSEGALGIGEAVVQVPLVVAGTSDADTQWNNLVDVTQNNHWTSNTTITNNGDLGGGSDANEPAAPDVKVEVFTSGNVLPAIVGGTTAITSLTTWPAVALATLASLGTAAVSWLLDIAKWEAAADSVADNLPDLVQEAAEQLRHNEAMLKVERIAVALECICDQLQASAPPDESTIWDQLEQIRYNLDAVATSRSEIDLQMKGIRVTAHGGVVEDPPP